LAKGGKCKSVRNFKTNDNIHPVGNKFQGNRMDFILNDEVNFTNVWSFLPENKVNKNSNNTKHPTVKPIALLERLIKLCTPENATVLDCFMGSGSTAIACLETKRNYIGFELDKSYYETSQNRISSLCGGLFSNSFLTETSIGTE